MKKIFSILLLLLLIGCQKKDTISKSDVLVSIAPYAYFVERIAGNTLVVDTLIPEDTNPHLYEPLPKQIDAISKASIWFRLGEPQEKKVLKILKEHNPSLIDTDLCYGIPLISNQDDVCPSGHSHEGKDRHVWLSPKLARYQIKKIAAALIELYPQNKGFYLQNTKTLLKDLELLDIDIRTQLAPFKGQAILVSHPAFAYFCRDYKMLQLSVECEGKEPLPQDIEKLLHLARTHHVRSVLIQAQYNNKGAELIAKNLRLPVYLVDPYTKNYIENLRNISSLIAQ